jgi:hypothetical protein
MTAADAFQGSMLKRTFDGRLFRIIFGTTVGVPLTVVALMAVPDGLMLTIGAMQRRNVLLSLLGPAIFLGLVGIAGAWRRLTKTHGMMTSRERRIVRALLTCGIASSTYLAVAALTLPDLGKVMAVPLLALVVGGVIFVLATPP